MLIENLKTIRRRALRSLKMRAIHKVIRLLKKNNYLMPDNVLEVFGYKGEYHAQDYISYVKHLEIWEIDKSCEQALRNNLPYATVKITDSYYEIKVTPKIFDTIIIDNHQGLFGDGKCEHFEIIEDCFKKLSDKSVIIANVIPDLMVSKYVVPGQSTDQHIKKRKQFYSHPSGTKIFLSEMESFYSKLADKNGFNAKKIFFVKRNYLMTYLVLCLERKK